MLILLLVTTLAQSTPACRDVPEFGALDFWVGAWDVLVAGKKVRTNTIEKILDGCAIVERWRDVGGGEGQSLFYIEPATNTWKQVWVTSSALQRGGTKEKRLTEKLADGALRFQGEIATQQSKYLDRTTLIPLPGGRVRQVIEISIDGGVTWNAGFDGLYIRR